MAPGHDSALDAKSAAYEPQRKGGPGDQVDLVWFVLFLMYFVAVVVD